MSARRPDDCRPRAATRIGFNGAALLSARRPGKSAYTLPAPVLLQRSRAVVSAETLQRRDVQRRDRKLQRSRAVVSAETRCTISNTASITALQRSRAVVSAETLFLLSIYQIYFYASTEPRCCQRGDAKPCVIEAAAFSASTEPRCCQRGDGAVTVTTACDTCASTEPRCCQRGDALAFVRQHQPFVASTEPRCCQRGDCSSLRARAREPWGFNGAALLSARRRVLNFSRRGVDCAGFNGAALLSARRPGAPERKWR